MKRIICFSTLLIGFFNFVECLAVPISLTYTYDNINRQTNATYSGTNYQLSHGYTYDAAGNITGITSQSSTRTLADAVLYLQVLTGKQSTGITTAGDINQDGRIGLAEAIEVLRTLSE